jgi:hypothetical protein
VQVFFPKYATNHPGGGSGTPPNWYYYWDQIPSVHRGTHEYEETLSGRSETRFVAGRGWVCFIRHGAGDASAHGTWDNATGIDLFANACRHEEQHRIDMNTFWDGGDRDPANDQDGDLIPRTKGSDQNYERGLGLPFHAGGYDPANPATVPDHLNYGEGWSDCEDYCMHREEVWINGSADQYDWCHPGKRWYLNGRDW